MGIGGEVVRAGGPVHRPTPLEREGARLATQVEGDPVTVPDDFRERRALHHPSEVRPAILVLKIEADPVVPLRAAQREGAVQLRGGRGNHGQENDGQGHQFHRRLQLGLGLGRVDGDGRLKTGL